VNQPGGSEPATEIDEEKSDDEGSDTL
jgi:hypothetical protein